jgi:hypothetical protein
VAPPTVDVTPIRESDRCIVNEKITPIHIVSENVVWYRRRAHKLIPDEVVADFSKPIRRRKIIQHARNSVEERVVKFSLMATLMRHKKQTIVDDGYFPKSFDYYERSLGTMDE